jgi:hypothetical protein
VRVRQESEFNVLSAGSVLVVSNHANPNFTPAAQGAVPLRLQQSQRHA